MAHELVPAVFQYTLAILGGVAAFLLVSLYRVIDTDDMSTFHEQPFETVTDFERFALAVGLMFLSFTFFALGGYYDDPLLLTARRVLEVLSFLVLTTVFHRWWRRFR